MKNFFIKLISGIILFFFIGLSISDLIDDYTYSVGQVILITTINIIMNVLGFNILYGIINIGTYYILLYILYKISKNVITNSKSQHIKRKTI